MASYLKFFALDEPPFEASVNQRFYYVGREQHEALAQLTTCLQSAGTICVLTGPSGCGKTALVRMLMRALPDRMRLIAIDDPRLSAAMLLSTILRASGVMATSLEASAELTFKLRTLLEAQARRGQLTTVILDEAQGLNDEVLEQLRLISNLEGQYGRMINFLLVGQEDLMAHLDKPQHAMLRGRIRLLASLKRFTKEETAAYLSFRLQQAGCHEPVFSVKASALLWRLSGGLPRLMNAAADLALQTAAAGERREITAHMLKKAFWAAQAGPQTRRHPLRTLLNFLRRLLHPANLSATVAALLCASGILLLSLYLLRPYLPQAGLAVFWSERPQLQSELSQALTALNPAVSGSAQLQSRFNRAQSAALFYDDALQTLIGLQGLQGSAGVPLSCASLPTWGVHCARGTAALPFLQQLDYPLLLKLYSDDLTPFYAVLLHLNSAQAELIVDDAIFTLKAEFLRQQPVLEYTFLYTTLRAADDTALRGFDLAQGEEALLRLLRSFTPESRRFLRTRLEAVCQAEQWGMCDFTMVDRLAHELYAFAAREELTAFTEAFYLRLDERTARRYRLKGASY